MTLTYSGTLPIIHSSSSIMSQQNSLFFSLPREIRDMIYCYIVQESGSLQHNPSSNRLRTGKNCCVDLSSNFICSQISIELRGIALQENSVVFSSFAESPHGAGAPSTAKRFDKLQIRYSVALRRMLSWSANCIRDKHLEALQTVHPDDDCVRFLRSIDPASRVEELGKLEKDTNTGSTS